MNDNKTSLTEFIKDNSPLLTAFGVFTALALYFKNTELPDVVIFSPLFLSLLIIYELYRNILREKKNASTTLDLFEAGLFLVLSSVFYYILSTYSIGRLFFGMGLAGSIFAILYPKIKKYVNNIFKTHIKILTALYLIALSLWYFVLLDSIKVLNFEPFFKEIVGGFVGGIFLLIFGFLTHYFFESFRRKQ